MPLPFKIPAAARRPFGLLWSWAANRPHRRTEALVCCFASAFVPNSDENRDGGRALAAARPTPFRGFGPHSPPRWRTRGRRSDCPCPSQEKSDFRGHVWPADSAWPGFQRQPITARPALPTHHHRQNARTEAFLRNLLTIARKAGGVKRFCPPARFFGLASLDRMQLPGSTVKGKVGVALVAQLVSRIVGYVLEGGWNAGQVRTLGVIRPLGGI